MAKITAAAGKRIGLTGGIASGKSVVAACLRSRGSGCVIDVDRICRELLLPDAPAWQQLLETFGPRYFRPDRTVNRKKLRQAIFQDRHLRGQLDGIVHPLARDVLIRQLDDLAASQEMAIVEVPLLYEARWQDLFDRVVVVYADHHRALQRLMGRDGCSLREAETALASQWPLWEKALRAHHVIDNSNGLADTFLQTYRLLDRLGL